MEADLLQWYSGKGQGAKYETWEEYLEEIFLL